MRLVSLCFCPSVLIPSGQRRLTAREIFLWTNLPLLSTPVKKKKRRNVTLTSGPQSHRKGEKAKKKNQSLFFLSHSLCYRECNNNNDEESPPEGARPPTTAIERGGVRRGQPCKGRRRDAGESEIDAGHGGRDRDNGSICGMLGLDRIRPGWRSGMSRVGRR